MKENEEKEKTVITDRGTLGKYLSDWKKYPLEQWTRELIIGTVLQASFKPPEKDICGGGFHLMLTDEGLVYICDKCKFTFSKASHRIFWTNVGEIIIQLI